MVQLSILEDGDRRHRVRLFSHTEVILQVAVRRGVFRFRGFLEVLIHLFLICVPSFVLTYFKSFVVSQQHPEFLDTQWIIALLGVRTSCMFEILVRVCLITL
jgi:hypothetical protein